MSSISEFLELVNALYQLGQEVPQYLLFLSELAEPNLSQDLRTPILGKLFEEVPQLLSNVTPLDFHKLISNVPQDAVTLRMLVNLHKISTIFQQMSCLQILHLTNNLIPPGPLNMQVEILHAAQEHMKQWTFEKVTYLHDEIGKTSLQFERKRLLELEPRLPWELLQFFAEILKLPSNELVDFFKWFIMLDPERISVLVQLLQLEPIIILEFKRRLTLPSSTINNHPAQPSPAQQVPEPSPLGMEAFLGEDLHSPISVFDPFAVNNIVDSIMTTDAIEQELLSPTTPSTPNFQPIDPSIGMIVPHASTTEPALRIAKQPPSRTVYQRILKPPPSVMLVGPGVQNGTVSNYFVETTLVRSDSDVELGACVDGNKVERVSNGVFAIFKKLKILSTSQQQGTLFRLKFILKKYIGNVFQAIPGAVIFSEPIEVFSHTQYLNDRADAPTSASVAEVLPSSGVVGTRIVILGANFINSPTLRCRFGGVETTPIIYHEKGTLVCTVPPKAGAGIGPVVVQVSNDGVHYCESRVSFVYAG